MDEKKKILILLSDTGGGHRASAGALKEGLTHVFGEDVFDFVVLDIWTEHGSWPFNSFVSVYRFASENPWCWRWMYESSKSPISRSLFLASGYAISGLTIKQVVVDINPHIIISVHPLCQHIILQILKEIKEEEGTSPIPNSPWNMPSFVTVVTDLGGAHPTWFHPKATRVYVPSTNILQNARLEGVNEAKIKHYGLPLRKAFWSCITDLNLTSQPVSSCSDGNEAIFDFIHEAQVQARRRLKLKPDFPTVLVVGGGEGVGAIDHVAEGIVSWALKSEDEVFETFKIQEGTLLSELQVIVVCGKNEGTRNKVLNAIQGIQRQYRPEQVTVDNRSIAYNGPGAVANVDGRGKSLSTDAKFPLLVSAKLTESPVSKLPLLRPSRGSKSPDPARKVSIPLIPVDQLLSKTDVTQEDESKCRRRKGVDDDEANEGIIKTENPFEKIIPKRSSVPQLDMCQCLEPPPPSAQVHVVVYSFASNIDEIMSASDLIVTKAGPGTIAEATTRGLPVLLSSYMPGQEEGNINFVLNNKFGTYSDNPGQIGLIVREWLLNPRFEIKMRNMRLRSLKAANPSASIDIARDIGRLIGL